MKRLMVVTLANCLFAASAAWGQQEAIPAHSRPEKTLSAEDSDRGKFQPSAVSPPKLFKLLSPAIIVVEALDQQGSVMAFGGGVAAGPDIVVTNKHVIEGGVMARVRQGGRTWLAEVTRLDADHDLCQLTVQGLSASPVPVRASSTLAVGERVYAIGAPEGLEVTLSEGLISGLREFDKIHVIQTTAPISRGSSGGGLFDVEG